MNPPSAPYVVLSKSVGQSPLDVVKEYKVLKPELADLPIAYAGRLDPMASGKLLLLIGDECKNQEHYHGLDKSYRFEVLLGTNSDTGDVLGLLEWKKTLFKNSDLIAKVAKKLIGPLELLYPKFSAKTVGGKPLHVWTLENRLDEIEIPIAKTQVYKLTLQNLRSVSAKDIYQTVTDKIETIPQVTEASKVLGADFRRKDVRIAWKVWYENHRKQNLQIATFDCVCSSGTYMRSLAEEIGRNLDCPALAYSIHRTEIGKYHKLPLGLGWWSKTY